MIIPYSLEECMFRKALWNNNNVKKHYKSLIVSGNQYDTYVHSRTDSVGYYTRDGKVHIRTKTDLTTIYTQKGLISSANKAIMSMMEELGQLQNCSNMLVSYKITPEPSKYTNTRITFTLDGVIDGTDVDDIAYTASVAVKLFRTITSTFKY